MGRSSFLALKDKVQTAFGIFRIIAKMGNAWRIHKGIFQVFIEVVTPHISGRCIIHAVDIETDRSKTKRTAYLYKFLSPVFLIFIFCTEPGIDTETSFKYRINSPKLTRPFDHLQHRLVL